MKRITRGYRVWIALGIFAAICAAMVVMCFEFYGRLRTTVREESRDYMVEISTQIGENITRNIKDNYSALYTIKDAIIAAKVTTETDLQTIISHTSAHWKYSKIMVIDQNGDYFDEKGQQGKLLSSHAFLEEVKSGKESMSTSETIAGKESIVFGVPIDLNLSYVSQDGAQVSQFVVLAAAYEQKTFDQILSMTAFSGKGYAHIVHADGTIVLRSSSENAPMTGYNLLNSIAESRLYNGTKIEDIRSGMSAGTSGFVEFKYLGVRKYMTYTKLSANELIAGAEDWRLLTFVPVAVVSTKSDLLLQFAILLFVILTVAFAVLFVWLVFVTNRNRRKLEQIAYVDEVTGGNTIQLFNQLAQQFLSMPDKTPYALIYINIEKFKVLNEAFGRETCDNILRSINVGISSDLQEDECIARLSADNFCVLAHFEDTHKLLERLRVWKTYCIEYSEQNHIQMLPFIIEFGVYGVVNAQMPLPHMIDRAKLALKETRAQMFENIRVGIYDESVRKVLVREKQLEDMMASALESGEFQVYLQPQYRVSDERVDGAEALVRWLSKTEGMIYPDEFIPLFEKNGFIGKIDLFVFETVCKTLRGWMDEGKKPIRISVNCSRANLKTDTVLEKYAAISAQYAIPRGLIEIEFTENIVFNDVELFTRLIGKVREAGFLCAMDDFGSGYSSLSMIQDISVDTLKLDKVFFRFRPNLQDERTESVVASILSMAKSLNMTTVAEGVEMKEQVEMLRALGCDLIQGYYFAKPMPIDAFEALAFNQKSFSDKEHVEKPKKAQLGNNGKTEKKANYLDSEKKEDCT